MTDTAEPPRIPGTLVVFRDEDGKPAPLTRGGSSMQPWVCYGEQFAWDVLIDHFGPPVAVFHPEPPEPTGLGAVVRVEDRTWVRSGSLSDPEPWVGTKYGSWYSWTDVTDVGTLVVLSEGVSDE